MDDYVPSRRELYRMIRSHGWIIVLTACAVFAIMAALVRKGILSWKDLANLEKGADG